MPEGEAIIAPNLGRGNAEGGSIGRLDTRQIAEGTRS
jgi:hypothetical protein